MEHDDLAGETTDDSTAAMITDGHGQSSSSDARMAPPPTSQQPDDHGEDYRPELQSMRRILQNLVGIGNISEERAFEIYQRVVTIAQDQDEQEQDSTLILDGGGSGGGVFRGAPASDAAVAGLEKRVFDDHDGEAKDSTTTAGCVICMEEFVAGDEVCAMPCSKNHSFHLHCIGEWLGRSNVCPLCRHALPAEEQGMMVQ